MSEPIADPPYVDDITVREVYAETVQVLNGPPGIARIEFCANHLSPHAPVHVDRVTPVARVVIPLGLAEVVRDHLTRVIDAAREGQQPQFPASHTKQ